MDSPPYILQTSVKADVNHHANQASSQKGSYGSALSGTSSGEKTQGSAQSDESSPVDMYEIFLAAVLALVSYRLATFHQYLPLNSRSFLSPARTMSPLMDPASSEGSVEPGGNSRLVTLDVRLTNMGTLIVTSTTAVSDIFPVTSDKCNEYGYLYPGSTNLYLSPAGKAAKYLEATFSSIGDARIDNQGYGQPGSNSKRFSEEMWKPRVRAWLAGRGIVLSESKPENWLHVQIPSTRTHIDQSEPVSSGMTVIEGSGQQPVLWPAELCHLRRDGSSSSPNASLDLLQGNNYHAVTQDPLTFAEDWFKSKALRDDAIEATRSARRAEELLTLHSTVAETAMQDSNSYEEPYIRASSYLDLNATSTVYPTPPDGSQVQGTTGSLLSIGIGTSPENGDGESFGQDLDTRVNDDARLARSSNNGNEVFEPGESETTPVAMLSGPYDANAVGLFGDIDTDMFGASGITEADFSFFDEPDLNDASGELFDSIDIEIGTGPAIKEEAAIYGKQDSVVEGSRKTTRSSPDQQTHNSEYTGNAVKGSFQIIDDMKSEDPIIRGAASSPSRETPHNQSFTRKQGKNLEGSQDDEKPNFPSPPLSPVSVKQKLIPNLENSLNPSGRFGIAGSGEAAKQSNASGKCQVGTFRSVTFAGTVNFSDRKYKSDGRFPGSSSRKFTPRGLESSNTNIPSVGFLNSGGLNGGDDNATTLFRDTDSLFSSEAVSEDDGEDREAHFETMQTQQDGVGEIFTGEFILLGAGAQGKPTSPAHCDEVNESIIQQPGLDSFINTSPAPVSYLCLDQVNPGASDQPLAGFQSSKRKKSHKTTDMRDDEYIRVAQVLTDQVLWGSRGVLVNSIRAKDSSIPEAAAGNEECAVIARVVESTFPRSSRCDLETYAAIEEKKGASSSTSKVPTKGSRPVRFNGIDAGNSNTRVFKLPAPHIRVQRAETSIEVLSSALPFWETFGFGPISGAKDVRAFCIYQPLEGLEAAAEAFLDGLGSVYENCKLGSHTRGSYAGQPRPGLVPTTASEDELSFESAIEEMNSACEELGMKFSHLIKLD